MLASGGFARFLGSAKASALLIWLPGALLLSSCGGGGGGAGGGGITDQPNCPPGQARNSDGGGCLILQYWSQLQDHQYVTGAESPHQQAFAAAGFTDPGALVDRSGDAHLFDGGDHGQSLRDLIFRIGIPDSH
ncbi:MAG: hypothetical protein OXC81_03050, partial [Betaproteobacteria bacterium]|nr:hypothetical protein [Betaproteobacteria bacterium]